MSVLLDFIYRFNTARQNPSCSVDIDNLILKVMERADKRPGVANRSMGEEQRGLTRPGSSPSVKVQLSQQALVEEQAGRRAQK